MQWRKWLGRMRTESDFMQEILHGRADAGAWVYDPQARTSSHAGSVIGLANMFAEYSSASPPARPQLLAKYAALLSPDAATIASLNLSRYRRLRGSMRAVAEFPTSAEWIELDKRATVARQGGGR